MQMTHLRNATLVFLIKKSEGKITEICLAMKKRGFGMGKWNGVGGKVEQGETIEESARREAKEEIGISPNNMEKTAEISFYWPNNPAWDQMVHIYFSDNWTGEPVESEEMNPLWFKVSEIPFDKMWADDILWLPRALENKLLRATFKFGDGAIVLEQEINIVDKL